jgi:hypothetical protein
MCSLCKQREKRPDATRVPCSKQRERRGRWPLRNLGRFLQIDPETLIAFSEFRSFSFSLEIWYLTVCARIHLKWGVSCIDAFWAICQAPAKSGVRALRMRIAPKNHLIGKYRNFETSLCVISANKSKFGEVTFSRLAETWVQHPRGGSQTWDSFNNFQAIRA